MKLSNRIFGHGHWHTVEQHEDSSGNHILEVCHFVNRNGLDCAATADRKDTREATIQIMSQREQYCPLCQN